MAIARTAEECNNIQSTITYDNYIQYETEEGQSELSVPSGRVHGDRSENEGGFRGDQLLYTLLINKK